MGEAEIKKALIDLVKSTMENATICKVLSVDRNGPSIEADPQNDDANILKVRLRAGLNGSFKGMVVYPKVGSWVLVSHIDNDPAAASVIQYTDIDSIEIELENGSKLFMKNNGEIHIKSQKIIMNDGTKGPMAIIAKLVQKYNQLESKYNSLAGDYAIHTHGVIAVGSPTGIAAASIPASTIILPGALIVPLTTQADLENTNITQG